MICSFTIGEKLKTDLNVYEVMKNSMLLVYPVFMVTSVMCSESFKMYAFSHIPTFLISMLVCEVVFQTQATSSDNTDQGFLEVKLTGFNVLVVIALTTLLAWVFHKIRLEHYLLSEEFSESKYCLENFVDNLEQPAIIV